MVMPLRVASNATPVTSHVADSIIYLDLLRSPKFTYLIAD